MADIKRSRSHRGASSFESILDSLRDYTMQAEELSRLTERHKARFFLVGYLLVSSSLFSVALSLYIFSRIDENSALIKSALSIFLVISIVGLPITAASARRRFHQYKNDLRRSIDSLSRTMRIASQITDHAALDQIELALIQLRLKEAEIAITHAFSVLHENKSSE